MPFRSKAIFTLLLFAFAQHAPCLAQNDGYIFRNINAAAGLASNVVTHIIQDDKGFIWLATGNGLQKYDGNSFITYHHDPYDSLSISTDNVGPLMQDRKKDLWIFTSFLGFDVFNPVTGKNTGAPDVVGSSFRELNRSINGCLDARGNPWLISLSTLARFDEEHHRLVSYDNLLPKNKPIGTPKSMLCDPRTGNLWLISYSYGICMLDPVKKIIYHQWNNPDSLPVFHLVRDPGTFYLDRENNLWVSSYAGKLYRYNLITRQARQYCIDKIITIDCIMEDRKGTIWMGARSDGLAKYDPRVDSFSFISRNPQMPGGLDYDQVINCLYEDREGNIWIASDKGISIFNPYRQQFRSVSLPITKNQVANTTAVINFVQTKTNDIWLATYGQGIQVFDKDLHYKTGYSYKGTHGHVGEPGERVWSFLTQPDGSIRIGSQHGWLAVYDQRSGNFSNSHPTALDKHTIFNMVPDSAGDTWMAMYTGIAKWDHKKNSFISYPDPLPFHDNTERQVFDLRIDDRQNIWVATQTRGLQKFDAASGRYTRLFIPEKNNPAGISDNSVQCIEKINDTLFALGTGSGGIDLFNPHTGRFRYITTREGLPGNNITALYFASPHDLWAASAQGLCKVALDNHRVFHYGLEDGIVNDNFSDCLRFYKTKDGRLLLGYPGGFVSFRPDSIGNDEAPADVTITGLRIHNQPFPLDSRSGKTDTVRLSYDQNFITLEYASLSYLEPGRIHYSYQLQGVDKQWVNAGGQRFAAYTGLPPGTYAFNVKSENRDGIPTRTITTLLIIIHPPFWLTWWFETLVVLVFALLLAGMYKYRIAQLLKLQAIRNDISKDLHDDVGATLSSIGILSEVAKNKMASGEQDQARSLLTKINSNSMEMVEKMSDIVWAINPKNETVEKIIQRLSNFAGNTCVSKNIQLEFKVDAAALTRELPMEPMKNIYLVVKEAMNNAIKHADCQNLKVIVRALTGHLDISVADDGKGFDPGAVNAGNGLSNMGSRVKEMKGTVTIRSERAHTVVFFSVPTA